jgi:hypothetical protein
MRISARSAGTDAKPRIVAIKERLNGTYAAAHQVLTWAGRHHYCYDVAVCEAILDYYALAAGDHIQPEAQANRLRFKRQSLADYIVASLSPLAPVKPQPLRFMPVREAQPAACDVMDATIIYICGLYALSVWLANTYLEGLKQRALSAPWNRLGLYLPLKAILEIQAEAVLRLNGTFSVR